ncbi:MAG: endolytic transglycosylase MltG [Chloroflexota bacterium]
MPPKRSSSPPSFGCLLAASVLFALLAVVAIAVLSGILAQVETAFGPASPRITAAQHWLLVFQLWPQRALLVEALDPAGTEQDFSVALGEPVGEIAVRLRQQGLIANADAFVAYLLYAGLDTSMQAGSYRLAPAMTAVEIAQAMQDASPKTLTVSVLAGWRAEEVAASLPFSGLAISPEAFMAVVQEKPNGDIFSDGKPSAKTAEGYLYPGLYEFPRQATAGDVLAGLLDAFEANLSNGLRQGIHAQGLNLHEGVILASIVQREAIQNDEMPAIASVFYNRLALGMPLASDPTVQYALGYNAVQSAWWTNPLSLAELEVVSPYNTYRNPGLPPGPISNPGIEALQAVANPAQTPYYYFRAACDGSGRHNFATTFEEHQANGCP